MSRRDDVEVVGKAVVLIVLSTSQESLVVHDPEICSLDGVFGVKGVRDPMLAIVVSTSSYLNFISYAVALASLSTIDLDQRRWSSCVVSWVRSDVCLNIGSIGVLLVTLAAALAWSFAGALATGLAGALAAALAAGLISCATSFLSRPSSATKSRGPWIRRRWRGRSDLLLLLE
jgi:hypothetical protein